MANYRIYLGQTSTANSYTLPVDAASYAITGSTVALRWNRVLSVASATYNITGSTVSLEQGYLLPVTAASLTITGQNISLRKGYTLPVTAAAYVVTGSTVSLVRHRLLPVAAGTVVITGQNVNLLQGYKVPVTAATININGSTIDLRSGKTLSVTPASISITGSTIGLVYPRVLVVTPASYVITGQNVGLLYNPIGGGSGGTILHGPELVQGANYNHIIFHPSASPQDHIYNGDIVVLLSGPGVDESAKILAYNGSLRKARIPGAWKTTPDITSEYIIVPSDSEYPIRTETAQAGGNNYIILNSSASNVHNTYAGELLTIISGTGTSQSLRIKAYNGTTKKAVMADYWIVVPDNTSQYIITP